VIGRRHGRAILLSAVVLASACKKSLPSAPSEVASGVAIYEHANFLGGSALLTSSLADLKDFDGPCETVTTTSSGTSTTIRNWDDCISSVRISPGWRATIYRDSNFRGQSLELSADAPNLQLVPGSCDHDGLNDCVTSIRIFPP
jgi:hypothetical protein